MTVHELRHAFTGVAAGSAPGAQLVVTILSFGFKHGIPVDSDLLFDVRFLPEPALRAGAAAAHRPRREVVRYLDRVERHARVPGAHANLLKFLCRNTSHEGKTYLTIGIGCTGGRHRSVAIAEALRKGLAGFRGQATGQAPGHCDDDRVE